jgi:flagella basal body P-ring formation protein FlgA
VIVMFAALVLAVALADAAAVVVAASVPAGPPVADAAVRAAIVQAVQARMAAPRAEVEVIVEDLRIHGTPAGAGLRATPDAGSRAGGAMRFILHAGVAGPRAARTGSADAVVRVRARFARATRALGAGAIVTLGDVTSAAGDPGRVPLQPLPQAEALIGARLRRTVAAGGAIAGDAVTAAPLVRRGDEVTTAVRVGRVLAQGRATALDDGALGAVVRVRIEKRQLRGRVRGAGEVEINP